MLTGPFGSGAGPTPRSPRPSGWPRSTTSSSPCFRSPATACSKLQYRADFRSDAYRVVPLDELRSAFNGTEIWRDDADADFSEGARRLHVRRLRHLAPAQPSR